jgi:hypothetical protein
MKLEVNQYDEIELREVYNTVRLVTNDGEELAITMRDSGFEFVYEGVEYSAKKGEITRVDNSLPF